VDGPFAEYSLSRCLTEIREEGEKEKEEEIVNCVFVVSCGK
jgi:hypothetical protein